DFISQEVPVLVEDSWAMGHGYIHSGTGRAGNGNGFKIGSSKTGIRHVVRNCVAWGNRASGFYANHSSGGNDWFNNTSYDNGTQFDMLASTWDAQGNRTDGVVLTGDRAHVMRNNIAFPLDNRSMEGVDARFNTWDLGITPSERDFLSLSEQGFMGPRNSDGSLPTLDFLRLAPQSAMIDAGVEVGLSFRGTAPDLGAYERLPRSRSTVRACATSDRAHVRAHLLHARGDLRGLLARHAQHVARRGAVGVFEAEERAEATGRSHARFDRCAARVLDACPARGLVGEGSAGFGPVRSGGESPVRARAGRVRTRRRAVPRASRGRARPRGVVDVGGGSVRRAFGRHGSALERAAAERR